MSLSIALTDIIGLNATNKNGIECIFTWQHFLKPLNK